MRIDILTLFPGMFHMPGGPKGVRENLSVVLPVLVHALELLAGQPSEHGR